MTYDPWFPLDKKLTFVKVLASLALASLLLFVSALIFAPLVWGF